MLSSYIGPRAHKRRLLQRTKFKKRSLAWTSSTRPGAMAGRISMRPEFGDDLCEIMRVHGLIFHAVNAILRPLTRCTALSSLKVQHERKMRVNAPAKHAP